MLKKLINLTSIFLLFVMTSSLQAQRNRDVDVYYEKSRSKKGEYQFYCENKTNLRHTITVKMDLSNMRITGGNPWKGDIKPGKNRLFSIKPINENSTFNFSYSYTYKIGCKRPKPNKDIKYNLPVAEGVSVSTLPVSYVGDQFGHDAPEGFYSIGFKMEKGDTIIAMRRGVVMDINSNAIKSNSSDLTFIKNSNYILVQHKDCTVGSYRDLAGEILVEKGETIIPGQPIALVGENDFVSGAHFKFSVYYNKSNVKKKNGKETKDEFPYTYTSPIFVTEEGEVILEGNKTYKSRWNEKTMNKELSKGEKKQWKKLAVKD
ncbi:MAG: M23 family metallopeptidase [Saprospiraceae bacterium]|nr:M23 family metallopeptidase [Saprospiraceae bacterium]